MMNIRKTVGVTNLLCAGLSLSAGGGELYVSASGTYVTEDGAAQTAYTDLQTAVEAAKADDTVWVEDGFVCSSGTGGNDARLNVAYGKGALVIRSRSGDWRTGAEIRGDASTRCLYSNAPGLRLIGFRLVGGHAATSGGGAFFTQYSGHLENCLVADCEAAAGGGGVAGAARARGPSLTDCTVTNNVALSGDGGGVLNASALVRCDIRANVCHGAAWNNGNGGGASSVQVVSNCVFRQNWALNPDQAGHASRAAGNGGALNDAVRVVGSTFEANVCTASGGAISVASDGGGTGNRVVGNVSGRAGAVWRGAWTDCLVASNVNTSVVADARNGGGGVTSAVCTNVVLIGNRAQSFGGGAAVSTLVDCRVVDNVVSNDTSYGLGHGGGLYGGGAWRCEIVGNVACGAEGQQGSLAHGWGGGVNNATNLVGCLVSNNTAWARGGGAASVAKIWNCQIVDNVALGDGGGVAESSDICGTLIARNSATAGSGVFAYAVANCSLVNSTVTANTNAALGEAVSKFTVTLTNAVIWGNSIVIRSVEAEPAAESSHSCWPTATDGVNGNSSQNPKLRTFDGKEYASFAATCRSSGARLDWMDDAADVRAKDWYGDARLVGESPDLGWVSCVHKGLMMLVR